MVDCIVDERLVHPTADHLLGLHPNHLAELRRSGLTDATIKDAGIRSEACDVKLATILNWKSYKKSMGSSIVFPYRDADGRNGFARVKPDRPRTVGGKLVKYEQPKDHPNQAYLPPGVANILQDAGTAIVITEGEKKALAATQEGFNTIGLSGVFGWKPKGADSLTNDLNRVAWKGRRVYIAFDSDIADNDQVQDAERRLTGRTDNAVVVERLLSITGEDAQTVDRKFMDAVTCKLNTRLAIISNELPRLNDTSGALASRMIVLRMTKSFYGKEDHGLTDRLLKELPSILLWAIGGWKRLRDRGYFKQPESASDMAGAMADLASPISVFLRECCHVGPEYSVSAHDLYQGWKDWCIESGRREPGTTQNFGRDLLAALPSLSTRRRRDGEDRHRFYEGIDLVVGQ